MKNTSSFQLCQIQNPANARKRKTNSIARVTQFKELAVALCNTKYIASAGVTQKELSEITGLMPSTLSRWLAVLHRAKLIYISGWKKAEVGQPARLWSWGYMNIDVPKPKPMTSAQYSKRYKQKKLKQQLTLRAEGLIVHTSQNEYKQMKPLKA